MTNIPAANSSSGTPTHLGEQDIQFICRLVEECGKIAAEMHSTINVREKAGPQDLVTDADLALSTLLVKEMSTRFPSDLVISEEAEPEEKAGKPERIWYIDPIDGTDNYVRGDGQYTVMVGLNINGEPHFGCVHSPVASVTYYGGPAYGSFKREEAGAGRPFNVKNNRELNVPVRLMMGSRDRRNHPWVQEFSTVKIISSGSIGLKVAKVIDDEADVFVHLSGKLKYWDTVGPVAIALAAGLEAGTLREDSISYLPPEVRHPESVIIGCNGTIAWTRSLLSPLFFV